VSDSNVVVLNFIFASDKNINLLFDINSIFEYKKLDEIIRCDTNVLKTISSFRTTEILIQNEKNDLIPLSTSFYFNECRLSKHFLDYDKEFYDIIHIDANNLKRYYLDVDIDICALGNSQSKIRIWYVFNPTKEQKCLGFKKKMILKSAWFKLKEFEAYKRE
jgi:hypothetical protein